MTNTTSGVTGDHGGVSSFLGSVMGFHMNAIAALLLVIALVFCCLFLAERFRDFLPRFFKKTPAKKRSLAVIDVIAVDPKRRLTSVLVSSPSGQKALAVILTGGGSDICVGWMNEGKDTEFLSEKCAEDVVFKKEEKEIPHE